VSLRYVIARLITTVFLALAATLVVFGVAHFVPTDPIIAQLGDASSSNPEIVAAYRQRWGLDKSLPEQYVTFVSKLLQGDAGVSIKSQRPVFEDIKQYAPATFELATMAALLAILIGIPLGIIAAVRRDSWIDHLARFVSLIGVAAPTFWLAFIALAVFYGGLHIAPGTGRLDATITPPPNVTGFLLVDSLISGKSNVFFNAVAHMVLPAVVLAAASLGLITRTMRASMLDQLGEDYVRTARAKGVQERSVVVRHAARNALVPVVTLIGLMYAQLLSGAVMTETIFSWPGLGRYSFQAAVSVDFPAIMGVTLFVALTYLVINLIVDLALALIDPRVVRR
jgi:peptide/nickel transport system permease protein